MGGALLVESKEDNACVASRHGTLEQLGEIFVVGQHDTAFSSRPGKHSVVGPSKAVSFLQVDHIITGLAKGLHDTWRDVLISEELQGDHGA